LAAFAAAKSRPKGIHASSAACCFLISPCDGQWICRGRLASLGCGSSWSSVCRLSVLCRHAVTACCRYTCSRLVLQPLMKWGSSGRLPVGVTLLLMASVAGQCGVHTTW
jgi:hypothetical protein